MLRVVNCYILVNNKYGVIIVCLKKERKEQTLSDFFGSFVPQIRFEAVFYFQLSTYLHGKNWNFTTIF